MAYTSLSSDFKYWHGHLATFPVKAVNPARELLKINWQVYKLLNQLPDTLTNVQAKKEARQFLFQSCLLTDRLFKCPTQPARQLEEAILNLQVALEIILDGEDAI